MASIQNNQKLSEIRKIPPYTPWPTSRNFVDPCWLESESLLMVSNTIEGSRSRKRDMSTRFTYDELFQLILKLLRTALKGTYTLTGRFNFATNATNVYCDNSNKTGRHVINYHNLRNWLDNDSGFANTIANITYGDHTNPKY